MPLIVKKQDNEGNEQWMCGNCFGFVAPSKALEVPMETPTGASLPVPYCIPCVDSVDLNRTAGA